MGILNVTPDSFSDGGRYLDHPRAVEHGERLWSEGAGLVDVGGESTRPGATRVDVATELERVLPVVRALAASGVAVSVDTMRAEVARAAVEAGAVMVNDVSGGLADADMLATVARLGVDYVAMHWRAHAETMAGAARYHDVGAEVVAELGQRRVAAEAAGIDPARLVLDPGIGFAKTAEHNWALLADPRPWLGLGCRVLVGVSRKRFLGELTDAPTARPPQARDHATLALTVLLAQAGVWAVRTHAVAAQVDALAVVARLRAVRAPVGE